MIKTHKKRKQFKIQNPDIVLPHPYLMYESFDLNYQTYYNDSKATAEWLIRYFEKYTTINNANILDWGCGPARISRHLYEISKGNASIYATDYNRKSIAWCKRSIKNVVFNLNDTTPPLPYVNESFNIIFGISIFTHFDKDLHTKWFDELVRISKNGALLFLTLHGDAFKIKLNPDELNTYEAGELVVRGNTKIGHRTYIAFHPDNFINNLFRGHTLLEHTRGTIDNNKPQQDIWILRINK